MQIPFHLVVKSAPPLDSTTNTRLSAVTSAAKELNSSHVRSVFASISQLGYEGVQKACLSKLDGSEVVESMAWLNELDNQSVKKVQEIVANVVAKTDAVLKELEEYRNGYSEYSDVEIMTFDKRPSECPHQLVARGGFIYLKISKYPSDDIQMMSAGQLLSLCKNKLERVNLSGLLLIGAKLHDAKLNNRNLSHAEFENADLKNANLSDSVLQWTNLRKVNLSGADLSRTKLLHTVLFNADFRGAKLPGATMLNVDLLGVMFDDDTDLQDVEITLSFPKWTPQMLNRYFNHLTNPEGASLFTAIGGINNTKFGELKLTLAHQIIASLDKLSDADISGIKESLRAILSANDLYSKDEQISGFIERRLAA